MKPQKILVVCYGNIYRSVIAELCLKRSLKEQYRDEFIVVSQGIQGTCGSAPPKGKNLYDYPMEWSCAKPALDEVGLVIPKEQQTTPVDLATVKSASVILAMDRKTLLELVRQFPKYGYKMRLFRELEGKPENVSDCGGSNDRELHRRVITLIYRIANEHTNILLAWVKLFDK